MARRFFWRVFCVLMLGAAVGGQAFAGEDRGDRDHSGDRESREHRHPRAAPELDPAAAGAVAAMVAGGVIVLARRRRGGRS